MPQTTQILRQQNLGDTNPPPGAHFGAMVVPQHTTPPYIGRTQRANITGFCGGRVRGGLWRFWEPQNLGHVHIIHPGISSGALDDMHVA